MTTQSDQVQRAAGLLDSASRIAIACHLGPDPDAIGSLLGLGLAMQERGKTVHLLTDGPIPRSVQWLPSVDQIRLKPLTDEPVDLFVALDSSDPERLGEVGQPLIANDELTTLVIDHHATNTEFGDVNLITVEAAATAEQIVYVLDALQHAISQPVAECLLAAFIGDTVGFSVSSVTPLTMRIAARLMEAGAALHEISDRILNIRTLDEIRLWGIGMANTHLEQGVLWSVITEEERRDNGLMDTSRSRLSNTLLCVPEAYVAVSFAANSDGEIDVSMRARPGYDVGSIAYELGGGGHTLAAGCTLKGPMEEVVRRVVTMLKQETTDAVRDS